MVNKVAVNAEGKTLDDAVKVIVWSAKLNECLRLKGLDVCQKILVRKPWQRTTVANYLELTNLIEARYF